MSYATLMVHLEPGHSNKAVLDVAARLASRFKARAIGIAACQPLPVVYGDGVMSGELMVQYSDEMAAQILAAQADFVSALETHATALEWRSAQLVASVNDYVVTQARCADLIITGVATGDLFDSSHALSRSDLVLRAGRPVLVVPSGVVAPKLDWMLVGWTDSRESRRAVADALPLLKTAAHVTVMELADNDGHSAAQAGVKDVVAWLVAHGVAAVGETPLASDNVASQLDALALEQGADLVVAGAWGHSRLREWVLGGVTRQLMHSADRCSLLSH